MWTCQLANVVQATRFRSTRRHKAGDCVGLQDQTLKPIPKALRPIQALCVLAPVLAFTITKIGKLRRVHSVRSTVACNLGWAALTSLDFSIPVAYSLEFRSSYGLHQKALISAFHSHQDFYHCLERDIGLCLLVCCTCDVHTLLRHIKRNGTGGTSMADHLRDRLKW